MPDLHLTDIQERALIALADIYRDGMTEMVEATFVLRRLMREADQAGNEQEWARWHRQSAPGFGRVLGALAEKGLVEREFVESQAAWKYVLSAEGLAVCNSMGD